MFAHFHREVIVPPGRIVFLLSLILTIAVAATGDAPLRFSDQPIVPNSHFVRWGDISVQVPNDFDVKAFKRFAPPEMNPPDGGQILELARGDSRLVLDAYSGNTIHDTVLDPDRHAIDAVLRTMTIARWPAEAWPYSRIVPSEPRFRSGNLMVFRPDPASGFTMSEEISGHGAIILTNGRSRLAIDAETGEIILRSVAAEDDSAINNFLAEVEYFPRASPR